MNPPEPRRRSGSNDISEVALPGIGQRYELRSAEGDSVIVIVHHSGRRDIYILDRRDDSPASIALTESQARALGAILGSASIKPAVVNEIEAVIDGLLIEWVTLDEESPGAGRTIAELEVRGRTKMTIVAILRNDSTLVAPEPTEVLRPDDRLVVMGRPEDLPGFRRHVVRS